MFLNRGGAGCGRFHDFEVATRRLAVVVAHWDLEQRRPWSCAQVFFRSAEVEVLVRVSEGHTAVFICKRAGARVGVTIELLHLGRCLCCRNIYAMGSGRPTVPNGAVTAGAPRRMSQWWFARKAVACRRHVLFLSVQDLVL